MYSIFGMAAILGLLIVESLQPVIGFKGMLIICVLSSSTAAGFTYFYKFNEPLSYSTLLGYVEKGTPSNNIESTNENKKPMIEKW